ncbi:MAG: DNA cytosine methyltransferase [Treponema sp.]|nr:DNA cytosine methyltransferase [Treponema sp.]
MPINRLNVIDLFAGVGGLSLGFEMAGAKILMANEYDESIATSYVKNRPNNNMIIEDITKLDIESTFKTIKDSVDIIVGGPPCQGFSQKGQRKTINDSRNFLFKYYFNVVDYIRPKYFVMENVPNLLTAENGYFKKEITELFSKIGYTIDSDVLNASDFGIPQNRRRAFIIGKLGNRKVQFPPKKTIKTTAWEAISDLAFLNSGEGEFEQQYRFAPQSEYQKLLRNNNEKLYNHITTSHSEIAIKRMAMVPEGGGRSDLPKEELTKSIYSGTWGRIIKDDITVTITTRFDTPSSGRFTHPFLNRAITVREAARIQSFPDSFIFYGTKTSQMKQVGNAVPPLLAKAVAEAIITDMENEL